MPMAKVLNLFPSCLHTSNRKPSDGRSTRKGNEKDQTQSTHECLLSIYILLGICTVDVMTGRAIHVDI
jgi:hypothetical protein